MKKILLGLLVMVAGCTLTPRYEVPQVVTSDVWRVAGDVTSTTIPMNWWEGFGSADLNGLEIRAAEANTDVRAAMARVVQARAGLRQATAGLLPTVNANLNTSKRFDDGATDTTFNTSAGATLAYEVDVFGRLRAGRSAAKARLEGTEYTREVTDLAVQGDVAAGYFAVLGARERLLLTQQSLTFAEEILRLVKLRYEAGVLSNVEMTQQTNQVAGLRAAKLAQAAQVQMTENALAVLVGESASVFRAPSGTLVSLTAPAVPLQAPATVMMQRPDVRAAEASLRAANADIGVARANLFPQLNLSLSGALAIDPTAPQASIGAGLVAPIFRGGSLMAAVTASQARKVELVETYRGVVLNALREVEDALTNVQSLQGQLSEQQVAAENARETARLAQLRFDAGAIGMTELLDAQRTLLSSVSALSSAREGYLAGMVDLVRALGG